mgnify:FL=1
MKKEKMNDKGFSLVELIIVIAIMAVLVVVLAPQYLKYVERSRNSTDLQNATSAVTACQVWAADPEATPAFTGGKAFKIAVTSSDAAAISGDNAEAAKAALKSAAIDLDGLKCKSKSKWTAFTIEGNVTADGEIKFTYTCTGDDATAFSNAMAGKTTTSTESGS